MLRRNFSLFRIFSKNQKNFPSENCFLAFLLLSKSLFVFYFSSFRVILVLATKNSFFLRNRIFWCNFHIRKEKILNLLHTFTNIFEHQKIVQFRLFLFIILKITKKGSAKYSSYSPDLENQNMEAKKDVYHWSENNRPLPSTRLIVIHQII